MATVLVVEDNAGTRKMVEAVLGKAGYGVSVAPDGRTALELMAKAPPDLILQDMLLPDIDGFDLVTALRALPGGTDVPIIAYSGFLSREEGDRVSAAGFTDLLLKPVEPSRLVETIKSYLPLAPPEGVPGKGRRVLVVDDDPAQLKLVSGRLGRLGFEVETFDEGAKVLERALESTPDAIVCAVDGSALNGLRLCMTIRAEPALARIPVLLLSTSDTDEEDARVARSVGASALVEGTPDCHELIDALMALLVKRVSPGETLEPSRANQRVGPTHRFSQHLDRQVEMSADIVQECSVRAAGLSVLSSISDALTRPSSIDVALADALACCLEAGGISMGAVFLVGAEGKPVLRAQSGYSAPASRELERLFGHAPLLERALESDTAAVIPGAVEGAVELTDAARDLLAAAGVESSLLVPLVLRGERLGVLFLASKTRDMRDPDWLAFGRTVAVQISQAVALTRAFSRLAASEHRYRKLMEHANDAIFVLDLRGKVLEVNHRAEELLGRPGAELVERTFEPFRELVLENSARLSDLPLPRSDGRIVYVDVSASIVETACERVVLVIARDATERKRAQEEQVRLYQKANEAVRVRDEFLDTASRALRDPLEAVRLQIQALTRREGEVVLPVEQHDRLQRQVNRLWKLVAAFTDVSRIAGGRLELHPERVDLTAVVREVSERFTGELERAGCALTIQGGPVEGLWDRSRLEQVASALVSNAIRYGPGRPIQITVSGDETTGRLTVADHGIGIAPEAQTRIFERFEAALPGRSRGGLGLGLWIARQIVDASGGTILVASRPGKGAVFTVSLPRA